MEYNIEELLEKTAEYNKAIWNAAKVKRQEFNKDAVFYRFDFDSMENKKIDFDKDEDEICYSWHLEYIWAEYDFINGIPQKRFNFYCKDVDIESCNVHVIPGVFQEFELKEYKPGELPKDFPYLEVESETIFIKNYQKRDCRYFQFAEPYRSDNKRFFWTPAKKTKCTTGIIREQMCEGQTIDNFEEISNAFKIAENHSINKKYNGTSPKYSIVSYIQLVKKEKYLDLFKIGYCSECGLLTLYNCLEYTIGENNKENGEIKTIYRFFSAEENSDVFFRLSENSEEFQGRLNNFMENYLRMVKNNL